jgi:hypothetical protein
VKNNDLDKGKILCPDVIQTKHVNVKKTRVYTACPVAGANCTSSMGAFIDTGTALSIAVNSKAGKKCRCELLLQIRMLAVDVNV